MKRIALAMLLSASAACSCAGPLFRAEFRPGLPGWEVQNYENRIVLDARKFAGEDALVVTCADPNESGDTAWGLVGQSFPVVPGERLRISVRSRGRVDARIAFPLGFKEKYHSGLFWFGADGKPLGTRLGFGYEASPSEWRTMRHCGVVPPGAATARLSIGVANPHFAGGDVLAVSSVVVERDVPVPPPAHGTSLRDDGVVLFDGEPFFPIGLYGLKKCAANGMSFDRALGDVKAAGFNTVQSYFATSSAALSEFLDLADRHGLKVMVPSQPRIDAPTAPSDNVSANRSHPAVLGWYLADDASGHHSPDSLAYRRRLVRYSDVGHITIQCDTPVIAGMNRYAPYVGITEAFLPQIYNFGKSVPDGEGIAYVARDMCAVRAAIEEAGRPVRSVWPVLQHFRGWSWSRFPTFAELRASVYASIALGARGVMIYTYCAANEKNEGVASSPERWAEAARMAGELNAIMPDLLCRDAKRTPSVTVLAGPKADALGAPSVVMLLKASAEPLLIAVNAANEPVRVRFGLACGAEEVFENRRLEPTGGLVDDFAPLGVHVYRLKSKERKTR